MSTYAIGDIQGCFATLQKLLERLAFDPEKDRLWLAGDLVNRGPRSLEVLRWARTLGNRVRAVIGNHDLHLISRAHGISGEKKRDTLEEVLRADDRDALLVWLRNLPLMHREGPWAMLHGGLAPEWSLAQAEELAREAEAGLRGGNFREVLQAVEHGKPSRWETESRGHDRIQATVQIFTRLRMCRRDGSFDFEYKGPPHEAPPGEIPWFEAPQRRADDATLLFGHWAALGLQVEKRFIALDSGCVWKNFLSAVRLEDRQVFQEAYAD